MKKTTLLSLLCTALLTACADAPLKQAETYLHEHKYDKAKQVLESLELSSEAPEDTQALLAQALFYTEGPLIAISKLQELHKQNPEQKTFLRIVQSLKKEFENLDQALRSVESSALETYLKTDPQDWFKERAQWALFMQQPETYANLATELANSKDPVIKQFADWQIARAKPENYASLIQAFPESSLKDAWQKAAIEQLWQSDKKQEAISQLVQWKDSLSEQNPLRAEVLLKQAEYTLENQPTAALNYYRTYLKQFPTHPAGREVIYKIREKLGDKLKSGEHIFLSQAADQRYMYQTAYGELSQVPAQDADGELERARLAMQAKYYPQARGHYQKLVSNYRGSTAAGLATVGMAKLERIAKQYDKALGQLHTVKEAYGSKPEVVADALWEEGIIYDLRNQDGKRARAYSQLLETDPKHEDAISALWYSVWYDYLQKDTTRMISQIEKYAPYYKEHPLKSRLNYWLARAYEQQEKHDKAIAIYTPLTQNPLMDYYTHRAKARLHILQKGGEDHYATVPYQGFTRDRIPDPGYTQAFEKAIAGDDFAFSELMQLYYLRQTAPFMELAESSDRPEVQTLHGTLLHQQGRYYEAVTRYRWLAEKDDAYLPAAFPLAFFDTYENEAKRYSMNPFLPAGLTWQESQYNPTIKSWVGATGLMQIMPATGQQIAKEMPIEGDYSLTDGKTNIKMGVWYLNSRHDVFDGNSMLAVASYNAGAGPVTRWLKDYGHLPYDALAESITYPETRGYVKRVFTSYWIYQALYGK